MPVSPGVSARRNASLNFVEVKPRTTPRSHLAERAGTSPIRAKVRQEERREVPPVEEAPTRACLVVSYAQGVTQMDESFSIIHSFYLDLIEKK